MIITELEKRNDEIECMKVDSLVKELTKFNNLIGNKISNFKQIDVSINIVTEQNELKKSKFEQVALDEKEDEKIASY